MFRRVLVAWDGSPPARGALDLAVDLARRYDATVTVVSVAHSPAHAETAEDRRESVAASRRFLEESFAAARDRAARAGVPAEQVILEGADPAAEIVHYAREHGFDLVVASRHRDRWRSSRFRLHDLADELVGRAELPVLIAGDRRDA